MIISEKCDTIFTWIKTAGYSLQIPRLTFQWGFMEDSWLKCEREWFVEKNTKDLDVPPKKLNKILETYNKFLQKALLGESPFVAEDLKRTITKQGEIIATVS